MILKMLYDLVFYLNIDLKISSQLGIIIINTLLFLKALSPLSLMNYI
jgi:hypothetical protein